MRGGDSRVEFYCGFTCVSMYALYSHAVWNAGAALSFKLAAIIVIIFIKMQILDM